MFSISNKCHPSHWQTATNTFTSFLQTFLSPSFITSTPSSAASLLLHSPSFQLATAPCSLEFPSSAQQRSILDSPPQASSWNRRRRTNPSGAQHWRITSRSEAPVSGSLPGYPPLSLKAEISGSSLFLCLVLLLSRLTIVCLLTGGQRLIAFSCSD